ncbi:dihydrofolate reductase [uncultured Ilyobacter sp.]|uniref:dihydrofolate reductase n=1 Tax=uncultured Ilyobacter sp. TaxID=544433 RepID=UPI0029F526B0|nr:dihydrofolate reductase [uncultured Ilyobacter sp.]
MISLIVAFDENRVIGKNNRLPWHIPEEMQKFKKATMGNIIIMGRKTFEGIGRPLPGRVNIVITKDESFYYEGVEVFHSVEEALEGALKLEKEIFFIGGESIYCQVADLVDKLYISFIHGKYDGDSYFPEINLSKFRIIKEENHDDFIYKEYEKKTPAF